MLLVKEHTNMVMDFFDLKFDGKFGVRQNSMIKDKRMRVPISNINKANHFWWIISKAYLNKFLLEDAQQTLKSFFYESRKPLIDTNNNEEIKESSNTTNLFLNSKWRDFDLLVKNDQDLDGISFADIKNTKSFPSYYLIDDIIVFLRLKQYG